MCPRSYHHECGLIRGAISVIDKRMSKSVCWMCVIYFKTQSGVRCVEALFNFETPPAGQRQNPRIVAQPRRRSAPPPPVAHERRIAPTPTRVQPWRTCRDRRTVNAAAPRKIQNRRATTIALLPTAPTSESRASFGRPQTTQTQPPKKIQTRRVTVDLVRLPPTPTTRTKTPDESCGTGVRAIPIDAGGLQAASPFLWVKKTTTPLSFEI